MKQAKLRNAALPALLAGGFILLDLVLDRYLGGFGRLSWPHLILGTTILLISYILLSRAQDARRRAEAVLRQARDEMESRVRERTAELEQANEALHTEVAERKRIEEALRESEERYRTLFDTFPEPTTVWDKNGVLLMQNLVSARNLGAKREDYLGKTIYDIFGEAAHAYMDRMTRVIDTGGSEEQEDVVELHLGQRYFSTFMQRVRYPEGQYAVQVISYDITDRKQSEVALRQTHEKLQATLNALPDLLFEVDRDGRVYDFRAPQPQILQISPQELLGKMVSEVFPEEASQAVLDAIALAVESGKHSGTVYSMNTVMGKHWFELSVAAKGDPRTSEGRLLMLARDISDRVEAESALRKERDRAQSYLDIAGVIIVALDSGQKVTLINARGRQIIGCPEDEILGINGFDAFVPERMRDEAKADFARLIAGNLQPIEYTESPVLTRDGDERLIAWHNVALRDEAEHTIGTLSSGEDITDRRRAQEALHASEEKFATVFHFFPDPLVIGRIADGTILDVNEEAARAAGASRSDIIGRTWPELSLVPAAEEQSQLAELFRATGRVADYELDFTAQDGEVVTQLVSLIPITVSGEPCALAVLHDITRRKRSETALRLAQAELVLGIQERSALDERQRLARELHDSVSQALYGISLGVNTALTLFDSDRTKVLEALNYTLGLAHTGLMEMRALIFELRPESLEKEGLVVALTRQIEALKARHGVEVGLSLCDEPSVSYAVKEAVYRISREALQNAVKHARSDRLDVRLICAPDSITLEVVDNGVGFDPQADYPGHLGLRSMRERAVQAGGTLEIASVPGGGTQIRARLPVLATQTLP